MGEFRSILSTMKIETYQAMLKKTYKSKYAYKKALFRLVVKETGVEPIDIKKNKAGNCPVCGESGRCCGLHFFEEYSIASISHDSKYPIGYMQGRGAA